MSLRKVFFTVSTATEGKTSSHSLAFKGRNVESALLYLWVGDFKIKWLQVYMQANDNCMSGVKRGGSWLQFVGGDSKGRTTAYWLKERE